MISKSSVGVNIFFKFEFPKIEVLNGMNSKYRIAHADFFYKFIYKSIKNISKKEREYLYLLKKLISLQPEN
ncbi:hypothetical protein DRF62_12515 [Chryseobacterium piscium]|uniref:Uncharacterized protein n=1 Tax=Chryseobacterium piscium TaxID=333702 RepID=A0A3D9BJW1_9FLAO|nr:hypothetical protein DRF69_06785 [Chryseobacterium sp. 5_R23647]REC53692.1 hypothetical protein DRF62_12515 [Chryseobacterium piscium]